ncbi:hypothetical protein EXU57_23190 [Segetibacter sp. 3557_3]|uniref:type VI secretion system TssO n=1 Tax=Segetibacter sp. 3557_3 TaxID=2547429 RepID=UPI00105889ED|nr:type VI secretion system TssO [Segetibacter sp. 3557_3]TDH18505.1 hypothetical protein EXU57_23190 [Segetibacter sp. 3557_3]
MELILNNKSRSEAYFKFLFLFVLSVFLIVVAVYFDVRIPGKDIEIAKLASDSFLQQVNKQQGFTSATRKAKFLIDSMKRSDVYNALLDQEIAKQLDLIDGLEYQEGNIYASTNKEIFNALYDYWLLSKVSVESKGAVQQLEKLKNESRDWETRYNEAQGKLDVCRKSYEAGTINMPF